MRVVALLGAAGAAAVGISCGPSGPGDGCQDSILAGDLVITEVFADYQAPPGGAGTDEGKEWFEIFNAGDRPLELEGLSIIHSRPDGSKQKVHIVKQVTIGPEQYLTLGNSVADLLPAYIDYGYGAGLGDFYNSDGGKLALRCGDTEIDAAVYDGVESGRSRQLTAGQPPDYTLNDLQTNWCTSAITEFDANNFGTPGSSSDCTPVIAGQCSDGSGMRDVQLPTAGDLVITEVMPNPAAVSDTDGEWFEIYAMNGFDLNGVGLDRAGDTSKPNILESSDCIHLAAGSYAIFAKQADPGLNGGLPSGALLGTFSFALVDNGDVRVMVGEEVIDSIQWPSTRSGTSHALDPDKRDPIANDDPSNFCDGNTSYGAGDLGTPGAANVPCPFVVEPGMCVENGTPRAVRKPAAGALVITEVMVNPKIESPAGQEWLEITNTGNVPFDVNGLGIDRAGDTRAPDIVGASECKPVAPGGYAVFARSADPASNAMLGEVDGTFGFTLPNTAGDVRVMDGDAVLDAITYGNVGATMYDGASLALDPDSTSTTGNDTPPPPVGNGAPWCLGTAPYGDQTNKGTPRAANPQCP